MSFFNLLSLPNQLSLKKRPLTLGEKNLARQIFGDSLVLDHVYIIAHPFVLKNYAISPNGCIYFNKKDWYEDFSTQSLSLQSWLIHELTHVWQIQQGIAVVRKALLDRRYDYVLKAGKSFLSYGIEQQAQMVQDYFIKSSTGQSFEELATCIPFLPIKT